MYKMLDPTVKLNTTNKAPIHFPNMNPPVNAMGEPNPKKTTYSIVNIISKNDVKKIFFSLNETR